MTVFSYVADQDTPLTYLEGGWSGGILEKLADKKGWFLYKKILDAMYLVTSTEESVTRVKSLVDQHTKVQ